MDDAAALRFFDERVRWQTSQFADAMRDVEVRCLCLPLLSAAALAHVCVYAAVQPAPETAFAGFALANPGGRWHPVLH